MREPFDYESAKKDTVPSKTQPGDYVIPVEIQGQNRGLLAQAKKAVADAGADPQAYVAGSPRGNYNPSTGNQQFFLKKVKKFVKRTVGSVKKAVKRTAGSIKKNPILKAAAIGAGVFFGGPLAVGALGKLGVGAGIAAKGAAASGAAAAAGAGKIASTAAWWKGAMGIGAKAAATASAAKGIGGGTGMAAMMGGAPNAMYGAAMGGFSGAAPMATGGQFAAGIAAGGKAAGFGSAASNLMRGANLASNFMPQQQQEPGFLSRAASGIGNLWGGMDGASRAALITGGFGALGGWADAKTQAKMRADDRAHEVRMENLKTQTERENFDDRNRIMGMGRDGQGGVEIDPNMVANWGLGDMSLPRRTYENLPPPNTPLSDQLRAGFLSGGL